MQICMTFIQNNMFTISHWNELCFNLQIKFSFLSYVINNIT